MRLQPLIMAVDDDREMLGLLHSVLSLEGFTLVEASGSETALAMLEEVRPDLILLDIVMCDVTGIEALPLIRGRTDVPIIMLTACSEGGTLRTALALGADDYVTKPFSIPELVARIRAKLRRAGEPHHQAIAAGISEDYQP